jgi:hypothetical protein
MKKGFFLVHTPSSILHGMLVSLQLVPKRVGYNFILFYRPHTSHALKQHRLIKSGSRTLDLPFPQHKKLTLYNKHASFYGRCGGKGGKTNLRMT